MFGMYFALIVLAFAASMLKPAGNHDIAGYLKPVGIGSVGYFTYQVIGLMASEYHDNGIFWLFCGFLVLTSLHIIKVGRPWITIPTLLVMVILFVAVSVDMTVVNTHVMGLSFGIATTIIAALNYVPRKIQ